VSAAYDGGAFGTENCAIFNNQLWVIGDKTVTPGAMPIMQAWYTALNPAGAVNVSAHWGLY